MFTGIGTVVNIGAILAGGLAGMLLKGGVSQRIQEAVQKVLGLATVFIGAAGALSGMFTVEGGKLTTGDSLWMILVLVLGTLLGEWIDLDDKMERLGDFLKKKASRGEDNRFVEGFVTMSLVACVGAMAIVGSLQDALAHDPSTLFTKAILDGILAMILAAAYGKGVLFSILPLGVLQGGVTLFAGLLAPVFSQAVLANISTVGSILIFCVGVNLAFGKKFRVANMLPALVLGAISVALFP